METEAQLTKQRYKIFKRLNTIEGELLILKQQINKGYVLLKDGKNYPYDNIIWTKAGKPLLKTWGNRFRKYLADILFEMARKAN